MTNNARNFFIGLTFSEMLLSYQPYTIVEITISIVHYYDDLEVVKDQIHVSVGRTIFKQVPEHPVDGSCEGDEDLFIFEIILSPMGQKSLLR